MDALLSVSGALVIVIGAILLTYWAAKYLQSKNNASIGRLFKIVDRIAIGKEKYIILLQFNGCCYLLGVSDNSMVLLEKLEEPLPSIDEAQGSAGTFKEKLASLKKDSFFTKEDQKRGAEHEE